MELNRFDARGWIDSDENITINKHVHYEIEKSMFMILSRYPMCFPVRAISV